MFGTNSKILVAGMTGMVGANLLELLVSRGYSNVIGGGTGFLDLRDQETVEAFFHNERPEGVVLLAGRIGGIGANLKRPAEFIYENLVIQANVIHSAHKNGVKKLIFLASSSVYPAECQQPMTEAALLSGPLEPTNEPYSVAKIAGIKLCEYYYESYGADFFTLIPCNLYGPHDHFGSEDSHVIPALIDKFHKAKEANSHDITLWGTGLPRREFLYAGDLAEAILLSLDSIRAEVIYRHNVSAINIGSGSDVTIADLAKLIGKVVGFEGTIEFDTSKPDGVKQKLLDVKLIASMGWKPSTSLEEGLKKTYAWYCKHQIGGNR